MEIRLTLDYEVAAPGADFIFNIHAAHTTCQRLESETLEVSQPVASTLHTDPATGNRTLRIRADPGLLGLVYAVTVDLVHHRTDPALLEEVPLHRLPPEVLSYLYPSRYCQSDRLVKFATNRFGRLQRGHGRVQAYLEVFLGERWYIFDPSGTAIPMGSCASRPDATQPTRHSRRSSATFDRDRRPFGPWR